MIIFDCGAIADDSHRKHFIDPTNNLEYSWTCYDPLTGNNLIENWGWFHKENKKRWHPDYESYYAAAKDDWPIEATINVLTCMYGMDYYSNDEDVHIWVDHPESQKKLIEDWLSSDHNKHRYIYYRELKLRPDGDTTPWHELKEMWVRYGENGSKIEMAFERSGSPMIDIWKRYGVSVMEVHA